MKRKSVQYFHTIAFVVVVVVQNLLLFCFRSTCLKKKTYVCEPGNQTGQCPL